MTAQFTLNGLLMVLSGDEGSQFARLQASSFNAANCTVARNGPTGQRLRSIRVRHCHWRVFCSVQLSVLAHSGAIVLDLGRQTASHARGELEDVG